MGVLRGANLVGMLLLPSDACPISWLSKTKQKKLNFTISLKCFFFRASMKLVIFADN